MTGVREAFLGAFLAVLVTVAQQGMVRLVDASGASDTPALILVLLLAAFLGVLTAVATRMAGLPGATAPTVLVLGWIVVPAVLSRHTGAGGAAVRLGCRASAPRMPTASSWRPWPPRSPSACPPSDAEAAGGARADAPWRGISRDAHRIASVCRMRSAELRPDVLLLQEAHGDRVGDVLPPAFQSRLWWPTRRDGAGNRHRLAPAARGAGHPRPGGPAVGPTARVLGTASAGLAAH